MRIDDVITIQTPEGVDLELTLAGLGSRFGAALIDAVILVGLILIESLALAVAGIDEERSLLLVGIGSAVVLATLLGYFVIFEMVRDGRTPGKAAFGIRVVTSDGRPVTFLGSVIRNLLRLIDFLPALYLTGSISILASGQNQRLGDLAADTIVIYQPAGPRAPLLLPDPRRLEDWDVSRVTPEEAGLIGLFLKRIHELDPDRRAPLAAAISARIRPKVEGSGASAMGDEALLRAVMSMLTRQRPSP